MRYAKAGGQIFGSDAAEEVTTARSTAQFGSIFAVLYLSFEVVMKMLSSLLPQPIQLPFYALAAASSAAGLMTIENLPPATPPVSLSPAGFLSLLRKTLKATTHD